MALAELKKTEGLAQAPLQQSPLKRAKNARFYRTLREKSVRRQITRPAGLRSCGRDATSQACHVG